MPWILTVSPRSLAAGGVEVTERATGERSTRSIEDVEALLRGGLSPRAPRCASCVADLGELLVAQASCRRAR